MPLGSILPTLDAFGLHFGSLGLSGVALDLILEALGDILGMAWALSWPGELRMGWIALRFEREQCFARIQDPGDSQSGG